MHSIDLVVRGYLPFPAKFHLYIEILTVPHIYEMQPSLIISEVYSPVLCG
jgi:hypothetical protein